MCSYHKLDYKLNRTVIKSLGTVSGGIKSLGTIPYEGGLAVQAGSVDCRRTGSCSRVRTTTGPRVAPGVGGDYRAQVGLQPIAARGGSRAASRLRAGSVALHDPPPFPGGGPGHPPPD